MTGMHDVMFNLHTDNKLVGNNYVKTKAGLRTGASVGENNQ